MKTFTRFRPDPFTCLAAAASVVILAFILVPLVEMISQPTAADLIDTARDPDVLTFVGLPFYINAVKNGFDSVPERIENVSRSLGASASATFFRVTFPLAWRSMVVGMIMCMARAISEFGAIVIVAYHPMVAPVMIYERFTAYGLRYSQPVAVWLIGVCLLLFLALRVVSLPARRAV